MQSETTLPLFNAICMHCGYDLSSIIREDSTAVCPECGKNPRQPMPVVPLESKHMHSVFAKHLLIPTVLIPSIGMLFVWVPVLNMIVALMLFVLMFTISLWVWFSTVPDILEQLQIHPRWTTKWRVLVWSVLYLLPQILIAYLYTVIASNYAIHV